MSLWCVMIRAEELYGDQRRSAAVTPNYSGGSGENSPLHGSPRAENVAVTSSGNSLRVPSILPSEAMRHGEKQIVAHFSKEFLRPTSIRDVLSSPSSPAVSQDRIQTCGSGSPPHSTPPTGEIAENIYVNGALPFEERRDNSNSPSAHIVPGRRNAVPSTQSPCAPIVQAPRFSVRPCTEAPPQESNQILNLAKGNVHENVTKRILPKVFSYNPVSSNVPTKMENNFCSIWSQAVTPILEEGLRNGNPRNERSDTKQQRVAHSQVVQDDAKVNSNLAARLASDNRTASANNGSPGMLPNSHVEASCPKRAYTCSGKTTTQRDKPKYSPYKPHPRFRRPVMQIDEETPEHQPESNGSIKFDLFHYLISRALSQPEAASVTGNTTSQSVTLDKPLDLSVNLKLNRN